MNLTLATCRVRPWRLEDAEALARHADNRNIWLNLRDAFPHPYTRADADVWLVRAVAQEPHTVWAIEVEGEAAGGIGIKPGNDVERVSAEIGYWLSEAHWGKGIATEAVRGVTAEAVRVFSLTRLFALPFAWNPASCRVLEKAGYALEGRMRRSAIKDGRVIDQLLYAHVVPG